jgi:y4mF family transcriptional regulator|tara:strand:+ start:13263 stop:13505 length:243 start_codon:yes stop_codon:yes gene_type:complete
MQAITNVKTLGQAVRKGRKSLDLTQEQLAFAAGVGTRFIVDLEAGKATLTLEPALRVVDALGGRLQLVGMPGEEGQHNGS